MTMLPCEDLLPSERVLLLVLWLFSFTSLGVANSEGLGDVLLLILPKTVLLGDSRGVLPEKLMVCNSGVDVKVLQVISTHTRARRHTQFIKRTHTHTEKRSLYVVHLSACKTTYTRRFLVAFGGRWVPVIGRSRCQRIIWAHMHWLCHTPCWAHETRSEKVHEIYV